MNIFRPLWPTHAPKLAVTANVPWNDDMAERLERAVARSSQAFKVIEHQPPKIIEPPAPPRALCQIEGLGGPSEK